MYRCRLINTMGVNGLSWTLMRYTSHKKQCNHSKLYTVNQCATNKHFEIKIEFILYTGAVL